jgi:hypothetical protein
MLTRTRSGDAEMLSCELIVADGPHKGRKFWENWIIEGVTNGHAKSAEINRGTIKTIIDSAHGLKADDKSSEARATRTKRLAELEGMTFIGKVGVERGRLKDGSSNETWPDKNILAGVIGPDKKEWHPTVQPTLPLSGGHTGPTASAQAAPAAPPANPVARPTWAR